MIFDEYTQVRHSQRGLRGTGLGLPLCRKLALLLGGRIWLESRLGEGSKFYFLVPLYYRPDVASAVVATSEIGDAEQEASRKTPLLIVAGREADRSRLEALYESTAFAPIFAGSERVYPDYLEALRPCAAILVRSGAPPACDEEGRLEGGVADLIRRSGIAFLEVDSGAGGEALDEGLVEATYRAVIRADLARILLVDDDAGFRSILAKCAEPYCSCTIPAEDAELALELLQVGEVDGLVLDLLMPGLDGFGFLTLLRGTAVTRSLPVLVCSSKPLSKQERVLLQDLGAAFLPKDRLDSANFARGLVEARACAARAEGRRS